MLFHLVEPELWQLHGSDLDSYRPESLETEGFIHLSTDEQLLVTLERYYASADRLVAVQLDEARLGSDLRWDAAPGRSSPMPHLYRAIGTADVIAIYVLERSGGQWCFPWGSAPAAAAATMKKEARVADPAVEISEDEYQRIVSMIACDKSPVGIDAKHTHVLILKLLMDIDQRLRRIEQKG